MSAQSSTARLPEHQLSPRVAQTQVPSPLAQPLTSISTAKYDNQHNISHSEATFQPETKRTQNNSNRNSIPPADLKLNEEISDYIKNLGQEEG